MTLDEDKQTNQTPAEERLEEELGKQKSQCARLAARLEDIEIQFLYARNESAYLRSCLRKIRSVASLAIERLDANEADPPEMDVVLAKLIRAIDNPVAWGRLADDPEFRRAIGLEK